MGWFVYLTVISAVSVTAASDPLPRKVVLNADNMEILRLDIMAMEVRLGNYMKEQLDRVVAALDRHGVKLDESGADLRRSNVARAAALDRQAARMDVIEEVLNKLINATLFQIDVRPLIHGFEAVVKSARLDARAAADAAREAVVAANATREEVKEAVATDPSVKAAPPQVGTTGSTGGTGGMPPGTHPCHSFFSALPSTRPKTGCIRFCSSVSEYSSTRT